MTDESGARRHTARRAIAIAVGALLLLIAASLAVTSESSVCASCHAMRPYADGLATTKHRDVACYTCHLTAGAWSWPAFKARELFVMYPAALSGATVSGVGSRTAGRRCVDCHGAVLAKTVSGSGLRIAHKTCASGRDCSSCHDASHGAATRWKRTPVMEDCLRCHAARADAACDKCHVSRTRETLLKKSAWRVTHGAGWKTQHGMGDIYLCRTCHKDADCVTCHGLPIPHPDDFGRTHGEYSRSHADRCPQCHSGTAFCNDCHGLTMPHPAGFTRYHGAEAKSKADKRCNRCHFPADCEACHSSHKHPADTAGQAGGSLLPGVMRK